MTSARLVQMWDFSGSQRALLYAILCLIILCYISVRAKGAGPEEERRALLQLRDSLNHPNGSALLNEWVGDDYCTWDGIFCARNPSGDVRVNDIFLTGKRQAGLGIWYPNATLLTHFENLETLVFSNNNFGGWLMPEALCRLSNLKLLDLSFNPLSGDIIPQFDICSLSSLEELQLSSIYPISGPAFPILTALCGLKNLHSLDLSGNRIDDGNVPPCLPSNLSSLETLLLSGNHLQNSPRILADLCSLRNLKKLDLSDNFLDAFSLPYCLFHNESLLEILDTSMNNLNGLSNIFSDICKLQRLQTLNLKGNSIQSGIDPCLSLANLSNLQDIDLSNNGFVVVTESPGWIPSFQLVSLNLRNCGLNKYHGGLVPSFISSQKKIRVISLSYNGLDGALPAWLLYNTTVTLLSLRGNSFSGEIPLSPGLANSRLIMLDISDNQLFGPLPSAIHELFPT